MDGPPKSMNDTTTDATSIIAPLWKRKWLILAVGIVVAAGTYLYYKHQTATYTATTQLYLGSNGEQQAGSNSGAKSLAGRALTNEVGVINSPIIGEVVRKRMRAEGDIAAVRGKAKATASATSSFITITTQARTARAAVSLANAYAQAFIRRNRANYTRGLRTQIENDTEQLRRIELPPPTTKGKASKGLSASSTIAAANLATKINALESQLASYSGVQQVGKAQALPVLTSPKKNAIFGFVLGIVLASIAAYMLSRFDRRLRSLGEIEAIFQTQILAALPAVKNPVVRPDGHRAPAKALLEPLRRLHTTLELGDMLQRRPDNGPRMILFLSAEAGDGKSALVANLARVQSEAGAKVVVVEADFRRPTQARLLDANGQYGLADVLAGKVGVEEAMQSVSSPAHLGIGAGTQEAVGGVSTVVESGGMGSVSVLVGGGAVANPPALLAGSAMSTLLRSVADEYDYVLIDAPPPLEVSDAMPLLSVVDGIVMVARIGHTRDLAAKRLAQLLGRTASAPLIGAVVNCVPRKDIERYGFSWAPAASGARRKLIGR
jgi:Mrp family chromosome partitioning ATPase/capsular polysaccharide biosynthesis protein